MPQLFESSYRVSPEGTRNASQVREVLNRIAQSLDLRVAALETKTFDVAALEETLRRYGTDRINAVINPAIATIEEAANLGVILSARSDSNLTIALGSGVLTIPETLRARFAAAAYISIVSEADPNKAMIAQTTGYDRETGILTYNVVLVDSEGESDAGWTVTASTRVPSATQIAVAPVAPFVSSYLQGLIGELGALFEGKQTASSILTALATLDTAANLLAFGTIVGSPDKLPYFTSDDFIALTDFTGAARGLLAAADTTAMRTYLGTVGTNNSNFTGIPTAPTAALGTNTNQLATMAALQAAVAALVNSAPGVLDTLAEIAGALGNDPNLSATLTAAIAAKQAAHANLTSLSSIVGSADRGLYFTGLSLISTFTLTAFGRSLAAAADAAAARGALGLGALSVLNTVATALLNDDAVTNPKLANMPAGTVKANTTGGSADPSDVTLAVLKAAMAFVVTDIVGAAPLASAPLSGIPTAPTAALGNNTNQLATMAALQAAIAALVASSPGTLDTLNELAAALGNDPNFATTMLTMLSDKASISAPNTFSGLNTFGTTAAGVAPITVQSTDPGTSAGPRLDMDRFSATPAVNDTLGHLRFTGRNDAAALLGYGSVLATILGPVAGAENGRLTLQASVSGTLGPQWIVEAGVYAVGSTGGAKGVGTGNFTGLYEQGTALTAKYAQLATANAFTLTQTFNASAVVDRVGTSAQAGLSLKRDAGFQAKVFYYTGGTTARFDAGINATPETGTDAGSDYVIAAYSDAGTLLGNALVITRSNRDVNVVAGNLLMGGAAVFDSNRILRLRSYTIATLPGASVAGGATVYCSDLGGGGGALTSDATNWRRNSPGQTVKANTTAFTWTPLTDAEEIKLIGTIAADQAITLSTTNAYKGARVRFKRTGAGAFNWTVVHADGTATIGIGASAAFIYDGAAWYMAT